MAPTQKIILGLSANAPVLGANASISGNSAISLNTNSAIIRDVGRLDQMIINSRYPRNTNFLHPTGFKFVINKTPVVEYLCQAVNLPSVSLGEIAQHNYFSGIKIPGDDFQFDDLSVTFLVDESMKNWFEIYNWMRQISNVEDFSEYETEKGSRLEDATLHIFTSGKNENIRMTFKDCFPKSLTGIDFDSSVSDIEPPLSTVVFVYTTYSIDFVKDPA